MKRWLALSCALLATACVSHPKPEYFATLAAPSEIPGSFLALQEVEAVYGERKIKFQAALQKQGDVITLLGFTPFGTRAFLLQQRGAEVTFTSYVDRELPFPPRYVLIDIHRAYFWAPLPGPEENPPGDGWLELSRDGEVVRERWEGGTLRQRTFEREAGEPAGLIDIVYEPGMKDGVPPDAVIFHNGWFGYTLFIRTRSYQPIQPR